MHAYGYLIQHACVLAARMKWTTWNWLYKSGKGMKVHGMVVFVGVNVAEWFN